MTQLHSCSFRIGHGYDLHRLQEGGRLMLAGVEVASDVSPIAHSDGDVVLHAIVDAILGAAGLGDIGEWFPNTDARWAGAASSVFVEQAIAEIRARHFDIVNCDVLIIAERPRLKSFKPAMKETLSRMLNCPVNVKAGTNEGCDAVGAGQAIAAHAVVLLSLAPQDLAP